MPSMETKPGCTFWCCTVKKIGEIPPKPAGVVWGQWAPHLTGRQITYLSNRWERVLAANTGQPPRRIRAGWPADLGASLRPAEVAA